MYAEEQIIRTDFGPITFKFIKMRSRPDTPGSYCAGLYFDNGLGLHLRIPERRINKNDLGSSPIEVEKVKADARGDVSYIVDRGLSEKSFSMLEVNELARQIASAEPSEFSWSSENRIWKRDAGAISGTQALLGAVLTA